MTRTTRAILTGATLLSFALVAGCATTKKSGESGEKNMSRVVKLSDGTTCVEPSWLGEIRETPGAVQFKALLESDSKADEALAKAKELKLTTEEIEAVYFDACRAYSNAEIPKEAFDKDKAVYFGLRQQLIAKGVKDWQDKKEGIADAGKLCLVTLPDTDPEHRSFTRVVPADATVNDCAHLAMANGSGEIMLGCTKGHWDNTWAKRSIVLSDSVVKGKELVVKGTAFVPEPDCGWNYR